MASTFTSHSFVHISLLFFFISAVQQNFAHLDCQRCLILHNSWCIKRYVNHSAARYCVLRGKENIDCIGGWIPPTCPASPDDEYAADPFTECLTCTRANQKWNMKGVEKQVETVDLPSSSIPTNDISLHEIPGQQQVRACVPATAAASHAGGGLLEDQWCPSGKDAKYSKITAVSVIPPPSSPQRALEEELVPLAERERRVRAYRRNRPHYSKKLYGRKTRT